MRPLVWNPPVELSAKEEKVAKRIRKAKLFVFLSVIPANYDFSPLLYKSENEKLISLA